MNEWMNKVWLKEVVAGSNLPMEWKEIERRAKSPYGENKHLKILLNKVVGLLITVVYGA